MMSYKTLFEKASKDKTLQSLGAEYREWKKKGDTIIGRLLNKNPVPSRMGGGDYYQYLMDTDDGLVKFALGRATDGEAGSLMQIGGIYSVKYLGTEKISGGRNLNKFEVMEINAPTGDTVGGVGDAPF